MPSRRACARRSAPWTGRDSGGGHAVQRTRRIYRLRMALAPTLGTFLLLASGLDNERAPVCVCWQVSGGGNRPPVLQLVSLAFAADRIGARLTDWARPAVEGRRIVLPGVAAVGTDDLLLERPLQNCGGRRSPRRLVCVLS